VRNHGYNAGIIFLKVCSHNIDDLQVNMIKDGSAVVKFYSLSTPVVGRVVCFTRLCVYSQEIGASVR
jgi:hypothetical protein